MRASTDVEKYQGPEVNDRQPVRIDRPLGAFWNEVIHDGKKAGGQEKPDGVVSVPPLKHRVLNAAPGDVGLRAKHRHRQGRIIAEGEDGDGNDAGEVEPGCDE